MTLRAIGLLLWGAAAAALGWQAGWPELTALGAAAVAVVVLVVLTVAGGRSVALIVDASSLRVVRGEPAAVRVELRARGRRRALRLVEGDPRRPVRTVPVRPGRSAELVMDVPVSTHRRGLHPLGPFTIVRGDPWSIVRSSVATAPEGSLLVRPRTHVVRRGFAEARRQGDSEGLTRRRGEDHFFALRDYVLGDEPRNVHWRSSARSGRLVVRQKVTAAVDGTLIVLDTDETAYSSVEAFSGGFVEERFEAAVEVAASLCASRAATGQQTSLATTSRNQPTLAPGGGAAGLIDALAVVSAVTPLLSNPAELPALVARSKCTHVVIVTGTPSDELAAAVRRLGSLSPVLIRVGAAPAASVPGALTLDVADAGGIS